MARLVQVVPRLLPVCAAILLVTAPAGRVAAACHCFRDRAFDPQRPAAADPYVLATTQNSLLAAVFPLEKKDLVRSKMTGTSNEDLWIAWFVAAQAGLRAADLLAARAAQPSWLRALEERGVSQARLATLMGKGATGPFTDAVLASAAVDATLQSRLGARADDLAALRGTGATDAETVAAVFVSRLSGRPASELRRAVATGATTWGRLVTDANVAPAAIEARLRALLQ